ncbi:Phage terminase [Psychrobacter nivimaris]|uniref:Phage terminase n=2 Tax=Psychrobacter nivimaris TaxID=281738 RepID=A0A6N7BUS9_9GAMM|nr:Phage terminase [Psychrobacter nivimaris]
MQGIMSALEISPRLNVSQAKFLQMPHKFRAFVAGFGSGKTWVGCSSLCTHVWNSPKVPSSYFAPTYPQIRDIFFPTIEECAFDYGLRVEVMESNKEVHYYRGRQYRGTTICRSMEKPSAIVGFKTGKSLVDELDLLSTDKARQAWNKIIARHRAKGNDADFDDDAVTQASQIEIVRNTNGIDVTTTPEGFKFTYEQFVKNINKTQKRSEFYGLIQASTFDNELNLPPDYIDSLLESYDPNLINAYLNGQFVNLASGAVYPEFDRKLNHTDELILPNEPLHIGMDFNVLKMAAAVNVIRNGEPRALAELTGIRDTPAMVDVIKEKYPDHKIMIYPDASGQNTSSKSSTESDHSILRQAGFSVYVDGSNPRIKDRVNAVNAMILNSKGERRFKVNTNTCPELTEGLEQQIYDKQGMPDKAAGVDHLNDAFGYMISQKYPITKPVTSSKLTMSF